LLPDAFYTPFDIISPSFLAYLQFFTKLGLTNTIGTIPGILAPIITGLIVQFTGRWELVFYLAAGISTVGEVVWLLFATGEQVFEQGEWE